MERNHDRQRRALLKASVAAMVIPGQVSFALAAGPGRTVVEVIRSPQGLVVHRGMEVVSIDLTRSGIVSVTRALQGKPVSRSLFANDEPAHPIDVIWEDDKVTANGIGIGVEIDRTTGILRFLRPDETLLIEESRDPEPMMGIAPRGAQGFVIDADSALLGIGQFRDPVPDYRNHNTFIAQANCDAMNPFLVSTAGWGLLWETGTAAFMRSRGSNLEFHNLGGSVLRYHVISGENADALVAGYRRLTGTATLLPKWAYGYWQSKERYASQDEVTGVVDEYRSRGLPLDAVVLDWRYWGGNENFSGMTFDPVNFPDPAGMVRHVHAADVHILASIWPASGSETRLHQALKAEGLLLPGSHWSGGKVFDPTSTRANEIYCNAVSSGLIAKGFDGLWTDGNEPEFRATGDRYLTTETLASQGELAVGPADEHLLTFNWHQNSALSKCLTETAPDKRPVILSRSAYPGQQTLGAVTWSGDTFASWETLKHQIIAGRHFCISGQPWWTCDIGGFSTSHRYPNALSDDGFKELYLRWFQFGAFLPVFRAHGTDIPREIWQFGAPGDVFYDALVAALRQRYALMPYIYSVAAACAREHGTMLRHPFMDFAAERDELANSPAFLLGRDILVHPIIRPYFHASANIQELIPNRLITGNRGPAALLEFFEGANFERPVGSRLTDDLKITWAGYLPEELLRKPYSARWTGQVTAEETGTHTILVTVKGQIDMQLGDLRIVGQGGQGGAGDANGAVAFKGHQGDRQFEGAIELVAGQSYPLRVELRQPIPDAVSLWVEWITPSQRRAMALPREKTVRVYLPGDRDWYEWPTGQRHAPRQTIDQPVTLQSIPTYIRAGSIIPMSPGIDRSSSRPEVLDLHVFRGHDGQFTLYDDAGDGPPFATGRAAMTAISWHDASGTLYLAARKGTYAGIPAQQRILVHLYDGQGVTARELVYDGTAMSVILA